MKLIFLTLLLSGCSANGLYNVSGEACAITIADADAEAGVLQWGDFDAHGKVMVRRGNCTEQDWSAYMQAMGFEE